VIGGYNPNRDTIMYSNANQHDVESTVFMFLCIFFLMEDTSLSESMQPSVLIVAFSMVDSTVGAVHHHRHAATRLRARPSQGSGDERYRRHLKIGIPCGAIILT
jgi:hypothetical protein